MKIKITVKMTNKLINRRPKIKLDKHKKQNKIYFTETRNSEIKLIRKE